MPTRSALPAWTPAQYKTVLREIARADHHAVLAAQLRVKVGEAVLLSMVEYNLVALRPRSELARDLPLEVFGPKPGAAVVRMPSPVELHYVLQLEKAGAG
jgi:hypothetical protein